MTALDELIKCEGVSVFLYAHPGRYTDRWHIPDRETTRTSYIIHKARPVYTIWMVGVHVAFCSAACHPLLESLINQRVQAYPLQNQKNNYDKKIIVVKISPYTYLHDINLVGASILFVGFDDIMIMYIKR